MSVIILETKNNNTIAYNEDGDAMMEFDGIIPEEWHPLIIRVWDTAWRDGNMWGQRHKAYEIKRTIKELFGDE